MRRLVILVAAVALAFSMSSCKTNDGNPNDSPSAGYNKCLNGGNC